MRVLYRDPDDGTLTVAEVTYTVYYPEAEVLHFSGDVDFGVRAEKSAAEKLVRSLYLEGRVDVTGYESCNVEFAFGDEEDDDDEDYEELGYDGQLEDVMDRLFGEDDEDGEYRLPHLVAFPDKKRR